MLCDGVETVSRYAGVKRVMPMFSRIVSCSKNGKSEVGRNVM